MGLPSGPVPKTVTTIAAEMVEAEKEYLRLKSVESMARNAATDARNRLNTLQREFDEAVAMLRKSAVADTDWKNSRVHVEAMHGTEI